MISTQELYNFFEQYPTALTLLMLLAFFAILSIFGKKFWQGPDSDSEINSN